MHCTEINLENNVKLENLLCKYYLPSVVIDLILSQLLACRILRRGLTYDHNGYHRGFRDRWEQLAQEDTRPFVFQTKGLKTAGKRHKLNEVRFSNIFIEKRAFHFRKAL